jgi:outer membrane protein TolC
VADAEGMDDVPQQDVYGASVMINLPIWRDKLQASLDESHAHYRAAVAQKKEETNTLLSELKMATYAYRDGERRIALYRDVLIPKETEAIRALERSYQAGSGTFLALIEAQRTLLEFRLSYHRALADRMIGLARIEMIIGTEL